MAMAFIISLSGGGCWGSLFLPHCWAGYVLPRFLVHTVGTVLSTHRVRIKQYHEERVFYIYDVIS
jgi:hypothetical protein